jgi:antibiotic biosynthesis monooxygenase (ABM) superfamily enzyme
MTDAMTAGPVTVTVARRVKPGMEAEYEAWIREVIQAVNHFAGHLGMHVLRPPMDANGKPLRQPAEYVLIFKFDSWEHLKAWEFSPERAAWLEKMRPLVEDTANWQVTTGLEYWFTLPNAPGMPVPPRHKMIIVTWLALTPLSFLTSRLVIPHLDFLPPLVVTMLVTVVLLILMTYGVMPRMTRLFAKWLFK